MAQLNYEAIEQELHDVFLAGFTDRLDADRCQIGDIDHAFEALRAGDIETVTDAVVFDFGGGTDKPRRAFGKINWAWVISGVYMIRYHSQIEQSLRNVVSRIPRLLRTNPRLNGSTPLAYVTEIGDPIIGKMNDISFYFIPFFVEALDQDL